MANPADRKLDWCCVLGDCRLWSAFKHGNYTTTMEHKHVNRCHKHVTYYNFVEWLTEMRWIRSCCFFIRSDTLQSGSRIGWPIMPINHTIRDFHWLSDSLSQIRLRWEWSTRETYITRPPHPHLPPPLPLFLYTMTSYTQWRHSLSINSSYMLQSHERARKRILFLLYLDMFVKHLRDLVWALN